MRRSGASSALWLAAALSSAQGGALAPLPVEAALSEKSMGLYSAVHLSPDQRRVAYMVCDPHRVTVDPDPRFSRHTRTGVWRFGLGCDVWVTDTSSGESRNLTGGQASNWGPSWSPDGRSLAFYSDRSGAAGLWVWSPASGKIRRVSELVVRPWGLSTIDWTPDSRAVVVPVLPEGKTLEQMAALAGAPPAGASAPLAGKPTVTVFENRPALAAKGPTVEAGAWSTELLRSDLARIDLETGDVRRLVRNKKPTGFWMSPDGSRLAVTIDRGFSAAQSQQQLYDVEAFPLDGGPSRRLAEAVPMASLGISAAWSPDSKWVAYLTTAGDCYVAPAGGGSPRKVIDAPPQKLVLDEMSYPFFDGRGGIYFVAGKKLWKAAGALSAKTSGTAEAVPLDGRDALSLVPGGRPEILLVLTRRAATKDEGVYALDLATGAARRLWEGPKSLGRNPEFRVSAGADLVVFATQDAAHPEDLFSFGRGAGEPKRLTRVNPEFDAVPMGESRLVEWLNADGEKIQGALLLPAGYQDGKKYPLVVFVYNSARLSDSLRSFGMRGGWGADDNFQLLATRGYAVFLPDSPSDLKDQMRDLPKNVLPGVNKVIELGFADPERLGVMGHSNGGYSTLALITLTTRFKAAVMRAGLGNLVGFYGELGRDGTHYGVGVAESAFGMGNPWNSLTRYLQNSPVLFLDRVETPLLIVHGSNDDAVAPHLAEEVFVDLQRLGKEVVFARYEGEGHMIEGFANEVDYCNRMIAWFDEHLKE